MPDFILRTKDNKVIRFRCYFEEAPITSAAFLELLPFSKIFLHARVSGQEIWTPEAPSIDIIQENASVFTKPGEMVLGPAKPFRALTKNAMGIYYGDGKGLDAANVFACVLEEDLPQLAQLGESIWRQGSQELRFEAAEQV